MHRREGIPQQRPSWDQAPEGDPRLARRPRVRLGPLDTGVLGQMAPAVMPGGTVVPGGDGPGAPRQPIWQGANTQAAPRIQRKADGASVAPVNNPFAGGGY